MQDRQVNKFDLYRYLGWWLCISHGQHWQEMPKKEQRPEAPQANSRTEKGARSPKGMLVEVTPVALLPGMGCCCKMPARDRGRQEGGESRKAWTWGSNTSWRQRRETAQGSSACSERLRSVWAEQSGCVALRWWTDIAVGFWKSRRMQYLQNIMCA